MAWLGVDSEGFIQFRVYAGNTLYSTPLDNNTKAALGAWYHVAATYSEIEQSLRLYVNGTLATNTTILGSFGANIEVTTCLDKWRYLKNRRQYCCVKEIFHGGRNSYF